MGLETGVNSGEETADKEALTILKPKIVRLDITAANAGKTSEPTNKAILEFVLGEYVTPFGAALNWLVSFDGEYPTTKVKGEKLSAKISATQAKALKLLAGVPGLKYLEIGNETSYGYQYGDGVSEASYKERAREYAKLVKEIAEALTSVGMALPLCQADDGNSGSSVWVDEMYAAVPELHNYVGAWVIHPYPDSTTLKSGPRIERLISQVGAHGGGSLPIDVTEWGITSDNGQTLSDGTKLTYAEATALAETTYAEIKAAAGSRLRQFNVFQARDQRKPKETGENREWYFGAFTNTVGAKGVWTPYVESILAESPGGVLLPPRPAITRAAAMRSSYR